MSVQAEMPKYKCHKEVHALKIKWIGQAQKNGDVNLTPEDPGYAMFAVSKEFAAKHDLREGCYYVVYKGGYTSISPEPAFEDGYTLIYKEKEQTLHGFVIETLNYVDGGEWMFKTDGHVDQRKFAEALMHYPDALEKFKDDLEDDIVWDFDTVLFTMDHQYICPADPKNYEPEDLNKDGLVEIDSTIMFECCGEDDKGAQPITSLEFAPS